MQNQEQELKNLEKKAKELSEEKIRKTEQLKLLRKQRDDIMKQLQEHGINYEELQEKITQLENEISRDVDALKQQLN